MAGIVPFPDAGGSPPSLGEVGGKGMSLWRMSTVPGVSVPSGFVLTTAFFAPWFESLKGQPCWREMLGACKGYDPDVESAVSSLHSACEASKEACAGASFDSAQEETIASALQRAFPGQAVGFVAVRSSSPEEDLAGMSFAGGYETVLGVKADVRSIEAAVRKVFASCLDERVFVYKISHSVPDLTPRIAVVVQSQVASSVAGVAFSLDPISNCYDWATINTNWGLGETVVSGQCSPDYFLVNKVTCKPIKRELGKKETSVWLGQDGGVYEKVGRSEEFTLSDEEVAMVTKGLAALEKFYGHPIDTEFALNEQRQLLWLQARPITTHMEIAPQVTTAPGCPEVLWLDAMQIVQGFTEMMSIMGLSFLSSMVLDTLVPVIVGRGLTQGTIHNRLIACLPESGVFYLNASLILKMLGWANKDTFAKRAENMDFNVAKIVRELDDPTFVKSVSWTPPIPMLIAWHLPGLPANVLKNQSDLPAAVRRAEDAVAGCWRMIRDLYTLRGKAEHCAEKGGFQLHSEPSNTKEFIGAVSFPPTQELLATASARGRCTTCVGGRKDVPSQHITSILEAVLPVFGRNLFLGLLTATGAGGYALSKVTQMFEKAPEDVKANLDSIEQGTPFVTTVLSDLLESMAEVLEKSGKSYTLEELLAGVKSGGQGLPAEAWAVWQTVIDQFGHRGVGELDMSCARYREEPELLLEQVLSIMSLEKAMRPKGLAEAALGKRAAAMEKLSEWLVANGGDAEAFKTRFQHYDSLFRYRETPKYLIIKLVDLCRLEVLSQAESLLQAGRIDAVSDVWSLELSDLRDIHVDKKLDVRALIKQRRAYRERVAHVKSWPKVLTSRGRALRPRPREVKPGEVAGHPVSNGVATGRVKVLRGPREKPFHSGEILVTKATDPGWTPLFVPAAAVLLEVGGALQHGALVAREFGKPCVAGIEDILSKFQDGMLVEVDGTEGIVKILDSGAAS